MPETETGRSEPERRFRVLYQAHYRTMLAYAVRRAGPSDDAADTVADVFMIAWRRLDQVPAAPDDLLWLYQVARRVVAGRHRSALRLRNLTERLRADHAGPVPQQPGGRNPAADRLVAALDRLPAAEREALQLVLWEQLTHAEAAQVLDCSVNAVGIRVHRAKARLRDMLASCPPGRAPHPAEPHLRPATPGQD